MMEPSGFTQTRRPHVNEVPHHIFEKMVYGSLFATFCTQNLCKRAHTAQHFLRTLR